MCIESSNSPEEDNKKNKKYPNNNNVIHLAENVMIRIIHNLTITMKYQILAK